MKLNIGCGHDYRLGWENADKHPAHIDVKRVDIEDRLSIPHGWKGVCVLVEARDVLEHCVRLDLAMANLHWVMQREGVLCVRGPHYSGRMAWTDPTHHHAFSSETFQMFAGEKVWTLTHVPKFRSCCVRIRFEGPLRLIEPLVNLYPKLWEALGAWPPAKAVEAVLVK